jgi:hypothetical protein
LQRNGVVGFIDWLDGLGAQDVIGEALNEKQRKPTQKKRHQSSCVLPRERSLCETVKNCAKKLCFN